MEQQLLLLPTEQEDSKEIKEVQSPFLSGTRVQYAVDSTSIGYLKVCARLYYYKIICGYNSAMESIHLRFGIEYHQVLHDYDVEIALGIPHDEAVFDVIRELMIRTAGWETGNSYKNRETLIRTAIYYLDQFGAKDPAKTHILPSGKPAVEVSFRFELDYGPICGDGQPYVLCGHLDRVVEFADNLYGQDRKTTKNTPGPYYWNQFEPNNQMSLYTLALRVIFDTPIKGIMIDVAQVQVNDTKFIRGFTYRSQDQTEEWLVDLQYHLNKAEEYALAEYWPMNDTACDKFGGCEFRTICSKSPQVRERFLNSDFVKVDPWNPLKTR